ncbi:MAG: hypothetical protein ACKVS6_06170 [Planctomycetota bacterium]
MSQTLRRFAASVIIAICMIQLLAARAFAGVEEQPFTIGGKSTGGKEISGRVYCNWPSKIGFGYYPVFVELENLSSDTHTVSVVMRRGYTGNEVYRSGITIKPGARVSVEVPAMSCYYPREPVAFPGGIPRFAEQYVTITSTAGNPVSARIGPSDAIDSNSRGVLYITNNPANPGDEQKWSLAASWVNAKTSGSTGTSITIGSPRPAPSDPNVNIAAVPASQLPKRLECYTSLSAIVVDVDSMPANEHWESILAWSRMGGNLILSGAGAETKAKEDPSLKIWLEDRFLKSSSQYKIYTHALGTVRIVPVDDVFYDSSFCEDLKTQLRKMKPYVPRLGPSWADTLAIEYPGMRAFPAVPSLIILLIFVIIIGPINFIWVKRRGKPVLLLLTIPCIAGATTLGFLIFAIALQGITVRGAVQSITLLDQRVHHAETALVRTIFAGLLPSAGLRPAAGTIVFPVGDVDPKTHAVKNADNNNSKYTINANDSLYSGDFLPARRLMRQMQISDRASRQRLIIKRKGPQLSVENGFEAPVRSLVIRDAAGVSYQLTQALEPGGRADVSQTSTPDSRRGMLKIIEGESVMPSTYMAIIGGPAFVDSCGISLEELVSTHSVFGILPAREEDWK